MSDPESHVQPPSQPSDPLGGAPDRPNPRSSPPVPESQAGEDRYLLISEKIFGTAMMFIGFLNVLLSISGGYEINIVPLILYCGGLAIWGHATIEHPTVRYVVMGFALTLGLAFFHYGEVLFWHKQVVFWSTILLVVFFMFKSSPK